MPDAAEQCGASQTAWRGGDVRTLVRSRHHTLCPATQCSAGSGRGSQEHDGGDCSTQLGLRGLNLSAEQDGGTLAATVPPWHERTTAQWRRHKLEEEEVKAQPCPTNGPPWELITVRNPPEVPFCCQLPPSPWGILMKHHLIKQPDLIPLFVSTPAIGNIFIIMQDLVYTF